MNTLLILLFALLGCRKKETAQCDLSSGICFILDNELVSGEAVWYRIPNQNRFRILWQAGSGDTYRNLEIDIYTADSTLKSGTFTVNAANIPGTAAIQNYASGTPWYGNSGFVEITAINGNAIDGTFNAVIAKDGNGERRSISAGEIISVARD